MCSMFGQIVQRTTDLAALKKIPYTYNGENGVITFSRLFLIKIIFALAGNEDMHKSLKEFVLWPDPITDSGFALSI